MATARLSIFEKIGLFFRGRKDAKAGMFEKLPVGTKLGGSEGGQPSGGDRYSSSFITMESKKFCAKRDTLLCKGRCVLDFPKSSETIPERQIIEPIKNIKIKRKRLKFSEAISRIDKKIYTEKAYISLLQNKYVKQKSRVAKEQEINNGKSHRKQLNVITQNSMDSKCDAEEDVKNDLIVLLTNEKIRLIEGINAKLKAIFSKYLWRAAYYYGYGRRYLIKEWRKKNGSRRGSGGDDHKKFKESEYYLPVLFLTENEYMQFLGVSILGKYESDYKTALEERDKLIGTTTQTELKVDKNIIAAPAPQSHETPRQVHNDDAYPLGRTGYYSRSESKM